MNIIFLLAPFSVLLGLIAVGAFVWTLRSGQYDDIEGCAARVLIDDEEEGGGDPAPGNGSAPAGAEGLDRG
jgi:cbb3-type cytochrome oxidase maturation protein